MIMYRMNVNLLSKGCFSMNLNLLLLFHDE